MVDTGSGYMNPFDSGILKFVNSFAGHSETFDALIVLISDNILIKGALFGVLFWWAWFRRSDDDAVKRRTILLSGYVSSLFGIVLARVIAHLMPFRERPLRSPELHMFLPDSFSRSTLHDWSAFPSDHAALFFALATTLFIVWRRAGIIAFFFSGIVICLPRIYLGLHHPTDIIAGAVTGILVAYFATRKKVLSIVASPALQHMDAHPGAFYGMVFFLTYLLATVCEPTPSILRMAIRVVQAVLSRLGFPLLFRSGPQSIVEPLAGVILFAAILLVGFWVRYRSKQAAPKV